MATRGTSRRFRSDVSTPHCALAVFGSIALAALPGCGPPPGPEPSATKPVPSSDVASLITPTSGPTQVDEELAKNRAKVELEPGSAAAHSNLGLALMRKGQVDEAIAEYRAALKLDPNLADVHYNLAMALALDGKYAEAIPEYREAIRLRPDDAEFCYRLGGALVANQKSEEAIAAYREALRIKPDIELVPGNLARLLAFTPKRPKRDYEEALELARKAVASSHENDYEVQTLAVAEYRLGHWSEAIATTKRMFTADNDGDAGDWLLLALAHWQAGEKELARVWFDKALAWIKQGKVIQPLVRQLWTEAAELMGLPGPDEPPAGAPRSP